MVMVHYTANIGNGGGLLFLSENVPFKDMISNHTNKFSMTQWLIFQNNILWIYVKPMWLDKCLVMISRRVRTNLCIKKTSNNADVYPPEVDCTLLFPAVFLHNCEVPFLISGSTNLSNTIFSIKDIHSCRVFGNVYINRLWHI